MKTEEQETTPGSIFDYANHLMSIVQEDKKNGALIVVSDDSNIGINLQPTNKLFSGFAQSLSTIEPFRNFIFISLCSAFHHNPMLYKLFSDTLAGYKEDKIEIKQL